METSEIILKTLEESEKPLRPGQIAYISGIERKEVDKEIKKLKKEEKIFSPKRCFYDVKK